MDVTAQLLLGELEESDATTDPLRFEPLPAASEPGGAAAVDGGHSLVSDVATCGIVAVRAGFCLRDTHDAFQDRRTRNVVHLVTRRRVAEDWETWVRPYDWGTGVPAPTTSGSQWLRGFAEAERIVAEFDAARRALRLLKEGDLLLLDGSLDAEALQERLQPNLLEAARSQGVTVVAVSKDSSLSLGGVLPLSLELEEAARRARAPARFFVDVSAALNRGGPYRTFGVRWDSHAPVYRVDVARAASETAETAMERLGALANDVAFPGYPYPLARAHGLAHFPDYESADLRHRLEATVAERRGSLFSSRLFGRGRDVLTLGT